MKNENGIQLVGAFAGETEVLEFNQLKEGQHTVRLARFQILDSFTQFSGSAKETDCKWTDANQQIACVLTSVIPGEGAHTTRFNAFGYAHTTDLSREELDGGFVIVSMPDGSKKKVKFEEDGGYVLVKNKAGKLVRLADKDNTDACKRIFTQFTSSAGIPEGMNKLDALKKMQDEGLPLVINIVNKPYQGKDQLRISNYSRVKTTVASGSSDLD